MRSASKPADGRIEPLMARHVELAALGGEVLRQRLKPLPTSPIVVGREEGGNNEVTIAASRVNKPVGGREPLAEECFRCPVRRFPDLPPLFQRPAELPLDGRPGEVSLLVRLPVEAHDLSLREPDQGIATLQCMVQEREWVVLGERGQPEGQLGQVDRHGVLVHPVEAALGHDAPGMEDLVFVGRDVLRNQVVGVPGPHQQLGQEAANGDEERPGAHGRVADLQVEDLFGFGKSCWFLVASSWIRPERRRCCPLLL